MRVEPLASPYDEYFGASIGNSQLIFTTNIEGGVYTSHKFTIVLEKCPGAATGNGKKSSGHAMACLAL